MTLLIIYALAMGITLGMGIGYSLRSSRMDAVWEEGYQKGRGDESTLHRGDKACRRDYEDRLRKEIHKLRGDVIWYRDREASRKATEEAMHGLQYPVPRT